MFELFTDHAGWNDKHMLLSMMNDVFELIPTHRIMQVGIISTCIKYDECCV